MFKSNIQSSPSHTYSHPLVKDIYHPVQESSGVVVPSYAPLIASNADRISTKIVKHAQLPGQNSTVDILLSVNLFASAVDTLPIVQHAFQCHSCGTKLNSLAVVQNHSEIKCNLCGLTTHINQTNYQQIMAYHGYRIKQQTQANQQNNHQKRRILFVIQASQYNYQAKIHNSVFNCLRAMESENVQIGFVLFDDRYAMFVNPATLQLTKVLLQNEPCCEWSSLPVEQCDIFIDINECTLGQLQWLVHELMYAGFLIKQTVLKQVGSMLHKCMSNQIEVMYFVTTFNSLNHSAKIDQSPIVFRQKHNTMQQNLMKKLPFLLPQQQSSPTYTLQSLNANLSPLNAANFSYFVIAANATYRQTIDKCMYNLARIYSPKDGSSIQDQLYYDLYQHIAQPIHRNAGISIRTSKNVELQCAQDRITTLYGNIVVAQQHNHPKMNHYSIQLRQASQQFALPLRLTYRQTQPQQQSLNQQQPFIQLEYSSQQNKATGALSSQSVVLNVLPRVQLGQNWVQQVDDELVFNHHLRRCLSVCKESSKELRQSLVKEWYKTVRWFINYSNSSNIVFPKNWKHYLLYSHILQHKLISNTLNHHQLYKLINYNLMCFSKYFYYRVYKLEDGILKNVKFTNSVFGKYEILFVENGQLLWMVMRDPPVAVVKDIFGYYDSTASLANSHHQLPVLESNSQYRNAIQTIRTLHQTNFLPLRIIDYQGYNFSCVIQPNLYEKQKHLAFLRRLWREA